MKKKKGLTTTKPLKLLSLNRASERGREKIWEKRNKTKLETRSFLSLFPTPPREAEAEAEAEEGI